VLDFTSALYLGLRHDARTLRPWPQLTLGIPAALGEPPGARELAAKLAALQGCERATLGPSTLHLFWDLFGTLAGESWAIYVDEGAYSIMQWGVERAAARGVRVHTFGHHDADDLRRRVFRDVLARLRPIVAADGFCPDCGEPAPIGAYLREVRRFDGYLVLDDTQALGILGHSPDLEAPYGRNGGGSLRHANVGGPDVVLVSSLAKGFGVPLAVSSGSKAMIRNFESRSETRVHCSPPSVAVIHAAQHALALNEKCGDALRLRLARLILRFRKRVAQIGLSTIGGLFPVQTLASSHQLDAAALYGRLMALGVRTVLRRAGGGADARISFLITVRNTPEEIDRAGGALADTLSNRSFLSARHTPTRYGDEP
jgi:8-amino-7-oxononanoate synthase